MPDEEKAPNGSQTRWNGIFRGLLYLGVSVALVGGLLSWQGGADFATLSKFFFAGGGVICGMAASAFAKIKIEKSKLFLAFVDKILSVIEQSVQLTMVGLRVLLLSKNGRTKTVPAVLPSFVTHVARRTAAPKILLAGVMAIIGGAAAIFNTGQTLLFSYIVLGIATIWFLDGLLIFVRKENGSYGSNDLEVSETARYIIARMKDGGGSDHFDRVSDPKRSTALKEAPFGLGEAAR